MLAMIFFYPIFIHRILLHLGLDGFPASEPVHITGLIGATFLRQRAAHMRVKVEPSGAVPPHPTSTGDAQAEASGAATAAAASDADVPPSTTSNDSNIRRTLDHVLTIQVAEGHILVDILDEIRGLRADLAWFRSSSSPPPFDDGF